MKHSFLFLRETCTYGIFCSFTCTFFQPLVNLRLVWLKLTGDENNQYQEQNFLILGHKDERKEKMWSQNFIKVLTDLERFSERSKKHSKE